MDVADWLRQLGLQRYEAAFRENDVGAAVLPHLTGEDLKELGVASVGHRRQMLEAIAALRGDPMAVADQSSVFPIDSASSNDHLTESAAERRQLSVMFCDVINSTLLSIRLDPEDLSGVIRGYQSRVATIIAQFGGFIARYVGDGILIYFGWPEAHETNAERAVRAALAVIAAIRQAPIYGERLQVRIGIATGLVVIGAPIGTGEARQQTAIGETPNLAARLQGLASPDGVAIDATTHRQLGGLFDYRDLGRLELKGFPEPVSAWLVTGERAVDSRFEALHAETFTPLIGRDVEVALLESCWRQTRDGHCQVLLLSGESGIGKSRLIAELERRLEEDAPARLRFFCSPDQTDTPLQPVLAALRREAHFSRDDSDAEKLHKLQSLLMPATHDPVDNALIADILSIPHGEMSAILDMSPPARKDKTLATLVAWAKSLASANPSLITIEDAHWADPSSLEYFNALAPELSDLPVLLIISSRSDETRVRIGGERVRSLILPRLGRRHAATLAASVTAGETLSPQMLDRIVEQTDGIPLFVVELTKTVLETSADNDVALTRLSVPASLQASLMARLDRIPAAKEVAQIGAVLGREFPQALLAVVAGLPARDLHRGLQQLVDAELATRERTPSETNYIFKHALIRDTAYDMLLRGRRRELHANAARALETLSPEVRDGQPELLAHHYTHAGMAEQAITCWARAARRSVALSAVVEAVAQLRQALRLVPELPEGAARFHQELELQNSLGGALFALQGWGDGSATQAYARAHEIAEVLGDIEATTRSLAGQVTYHIGQCQYGKAREISMKLLRIAEGSTDPSVPLVAHRCIGVCLHWTGDFAGALEHFDHVLRLYVPGRDRSLAAILGFDVSMQAAILSCWDLLILGFPRQAAARFDLVRSQLNSIAHKHTRVMALGFGGIFSLLMQDRELACRQWTEAAALATEQRFAPWIGITNVLVGAVCTAAEDAAKGLAQARQGYATYAASTGMPDAGTGLVVNATYYLAALAEVCDRAGLLAQACIHLDAAIDAAELSGERWFEPELHRLRGERLLRHGPNGDAQAEAAFAHALDRARSQKALLWELRAAVSLARFYSDKGRSAHACELLSSVTAKFTDGLESPELSQAQALFAALQP
jgi:class 3 adenylate cyclase/tetratricopeptide (TPR) repeat protein